MTGSVMETEQQMSATGVARRDGDWGVGVGVECREIFHSE